jgi:hypothetical protein
MALQERNAHVVERHARAQQGNTGRTSDSGRGESHGDILVAALRRLAHDVKRRRVGCGRGSTRYACV